MYALQIDWSLAVIVAAVLNLKQLGYFSDMKV